MKRALTRTMAPLLLCSLLFACASAGTRVTSTSQTYKDLSRSQQAWCAQVGCACYLDGVQTSCSLVFSCLNSGNCQRASQ